MNKQKTWDKTLWQSFKRIQQPVWPDPMKLNRNLQTLQKLPPLVFAGEIRKLKNELKKVHRREAFILQGGDCAETFDQCDAVTIRENLKVMLQMAFILTFAGSQHVVKIGRVAGQYAKPRSSDYEELNGEKFLSYRGDMVNSEKPDHSLREPDSNRLVEAYFRSAATLNLLRGFTKGGFAALENVHKWNKEFVHSLESKKYEKLAAELEKAIAFMRAIALDSSSLQQLNEVDYYTSHEALILEYEQALTRQDSLTNQWYDCSAHMLWIGERTRRFEGSHIHFLAGVENPIGIKIGPKSDLDELLRILDTLNPQHEEGKIVLVTRFGHEKVEENLTPVIKTIQASDHPVLWCSDPMHGNTFKLGNYKTRDYNHILAEILQVKSVLESSGLYFGGIHIEFTGLDVTECIDGIRQKDAKSLDRNYATTCDPRLNAYQSVDLAFQLSDSFRKKPLTAG